MKNSIKNLVLFVAITVSFLTVKAQNKVIKSETSKVVWKGYKLTGSHEGTIAIQSGTLNFNGDKLTGGEFVIDMTTINTTDLQGEYKGKLDGHLKSDDFFGVQKFPIAKLVFKKIKSTGKKSYKVTGDLTVKGITKSVNLIISVYGNKANVTLKIDRTKYGIKYSSGSYFDDLKDKLIYDEFDLVVDLEF